MTLDQYTIAELPLILEPKIENRSYLTIIDVPKVINNNRYDFNGNLARNITFTTDEDDITAGVHVIHQNIQILSINKDKAYTISSVVLYLVTPHLICTIIICSRLRKSSDRLNFHRAMLTVVRLCPLVPTSLLRVLIGAIP